jgi:hypothetical protein
VQGGDGLAKKRTAEEMEGSGADGKGKPLGKPLGKAKHAQPDSDTKKKKKVRTEWLRGACCCVAVGYECTRVTL